MRYALTIILSVIILANMNSVFAGQPTQQFSACLTDSLNGKERKLLAKWIYFGMSSHSLIKPYSNASDKDIEESNKFVGALITRMLTEDCPKQAKAALDDSGATAFTEAFRIVGEVAMQELMTEPSVSQSLGAFEKYMDQSKFDEAFQ